MGKFFYRLIVAVWAMVIKMTGGKLPAGVQFVPAQPATPPPAEPTEQADTATEGTQS
jgi:hypothetical protein